MSQFWQTLKDFDLEVWGKMAIFCLKVILIQNVHCPYLTFVILYSQTRLSWAILLVHQKGGFNFQKIHVDMVRLELSLAKDDILQNRSSIDSMQKSFIGIPFRRGQEIHVSIPRAVIQACFSEGSIVVGTNSSIGRVFEFVWNLVCDGMFFIISHSYGMALCWQEIACTRVNFMVVMWLLRNQRRMFMRR